MNPNTPIENQTVFINLAKNVQSLKSYTKMIGTGTDILDYLNERLKEVESHLTLLKNHKKKEMQFPLSMRRPTFLFFISEEELKYVPLLEELKKIKEIISS